jgi:hypothetical protein
MLVVGNLSYNDAINNRRVDAHRRCSCIAVDPGANQGPTQRGRGLQETPAI